MTGYDALKIELETLNKFTKIGWNIMLDAEAKGEKAREGCALLFEMLYRSHEIMRIIGDDK